MKYLALIYDAPPPADAPAPGSAEFDAYMQLWFDLDAKLKDAGVYVSGEALLPVETARTVRTRSGKTQTVDGPFAETKEMLGGFYLLDCKDIDEALHYAAMIPVHETGSVEVRPVMEIPEH